MDLASRDLALMGARIERIAGRMGFWRICVRASFATGDQSKPGILIMGHLDTVHPVGTPATASVAARWPPLLWARHL